MDSLENILVEGQKVKLQSEGRSFVALVDSVKGGRISVKADEKEPELARLKVGTKVQGVFLKEDTVWALESAVIKKEKSPPRLHLSWPRQLVAEKIKCYQRGGFTGVEGFIPFRYDRVVRDQQREIQFRQSGLAVWIGGNELTMATVEDIPRGTILAMEIRRPVSSVPIRIFGRVHKSKERGSIHHVRILFEALQEKDRDAILRYCLQKQASIYKTGAPIPQR